MVVSNQSDIIAITGWNWNKLQLVWIQNNEDTRYKEKNKCVSFPDITSTNAISVKTVIMEIVLRLSN